MNQRTEEQIKASPQIGDQVIANGFPGTITEICAWNTRLVVVRLARGTVCVAASELFL